MFQRVKGKGCLDMLQSGHEKNVRILPEKMEETLVGAAAGMSAACGYHFFYQNDSYFQKLAEAIARCPRCGGFMEPNMAGDRSFFQTDAWKKKAQEYQAFIQKYHGKKLVILEPGVGWRNEMIKAPFMQLAQEKPYAAYISVNKREICIPDVIADRSYGLDGDIAEVSCSLVKAKK